eukprot:TRINITY_DN10615_c0_g1_i1.p1 TRINITY_DN10615_c0_g1~~TRINITY_DN10615_c0_g1_i1.p1  ORF type:complete len:265 (-),score=25.31 TRINITY_DN10615_c0_g1_i1:90-884(-)
MALSPLLGDDILCFIGRGFAPDSVETWRRADTASVASATQLNTDPSLVWEFLTFYHHRLERALPTSGHHAIAAAQRTLQDEGRKLTVVTTCLDDALERAGVTNVVHLLGSVNTATCQSCHTAHDISALPPCPPLQMPDEESDAAPLSAASGRKPIPASALPHCPIETCPGHDTASPPLCVDVNLIGTAVSAAAHAKAWNAASSATGAVWIGASTTAEPGAGYASLLAARNVTVYELSTGMPVGGLAAGASDSTTERVLSPMVGV